MARASSTKARKQRHDPLLKDLDAAQGTLKKINKKKLAQNDAANHDAANEEDGYIDSKASRKILQLAKEQQDEIEGEELAESERNKQFEARFTTMSYDDEDEDEDEDEEAFGEDISDFRVIVGSSSESSESQGWLRYVPFKCRITVPAIGTKKVPYTFLPLEVERTNRNIFTSPIGDLKVN